MKQDQKIADTPLMRQYFSIKAKHPDALLLFRVGDFYETFGEDAVIASKILGIVLTKRANGSASYVELAGFPHHSIDTYLPKLVRAGQKVAICDQLEDPKLTKKIVKRGITELVTPGVSYNPQLLSCNQNNYLCSICFHKDKGGISFLDISTGTFKVATGSLSYIDLLLSSLSPKEVLIEKGLKNEFINKFGNDYYISTIDEWAFSQDSAKDKLLTHFKLDTLKGFGIADMPLAITAAGATIFYLELTEHKDLSHINSISRLDESDNVWIDRFTFRNLEIFNPLSEGGKSLIDILDNCITPMGSRTLREWIALPSKNIEILNSRHNIVDALYSNNNQNLQIIDHLKMIGDLERIISRAAAGRILPREIIMLKNGLSQIDPIKNICSSIDNSQLNDLLIKLNSCYTLIDLINSHILDEPAQQIGKGPVIKSQIDENLESLRSIAEHGKEILEQIQDREIKKTGISSLKIGQNNVFGYYLEVRNTHKDKVPIDWIRKQTLVSAERYITPELKEYEEKIAGAEQKILELEQQIFNKVVIEIQKKIDIIQQTSKTISQIDCLSCFAVTAHKNNYFKPTLTTDNSLILKESRHPVIEKSLGIGQEYISNDIYLNDTDQQIIILTGPNMAGKSALLRQTALNVLMAQIGSYIPSSSSRIGITDKIFTRVGASDNISKGESTFMVEMLETSTILHNLSNKSLVLLDEIGRGTSTYDGMSIAWSIVEFIHEHPTYRPKTLFATHYHELNQLEKKYKRVKNWHISVKESGNKIIFLRKLCPGGVAHSFGIHVAQMAGMPNEVIERAQRTLKKLEKQGSKVDNAHSLNQEAIQLSLYQLDDPLLSEIKEELKDLDINKISPLDAFDIIRGIKNRLGL